jgi:hypothetical protein
MKMTHQMTVSAVLAGLCACHSSHPVTEVRELKSETSHQVERVDCRLLVDDSLVLVVDNPQLCYVEARDGVSSAGGVRAVSLKAKSLRLERRGSVVAQEVETRVRSDSLSADVKQSEVTVKSKSAGATKAAALLAGIVLLLLIAYKFKR